jgi:hypothetical protein
MQLDLDTPLTVGEIIARSSAAGEHVSDVASRLVALAAVLVRDSDYETRADVAFAMLSHADFLTGAVSDQAAH